MEGGDKGKLWENAQLEMEGSDQEARMKKEVWERQEENQGGAVSCHELAYIVSADKSDRLICVTLYVQNFFF